MKATCIIGSPRANGSTAFLMDQVILAMTEMDIKVIKHCLGEKEVNYCLGCKRCYITGECVQNDDAIKILDDIIDSDIIIIGTPSYWGDFTGQLKVLFERSTPFCDTNPNRIYPTKKRYGLSFVVRAGSNETENQHIIERIEHYYSHLSIAPIGRLSVTGVDTKDDLLKNEDAIYGAYQLGKEIQRRIQT